MQYQKIRAFTLVELLVVIAIITILAAMHVACAWGAFPRQPTPVSL